jgi:predicted RNA-binding Zn-ribbon protein involved in translation (DUF1610 family)
MSDECDNVDEGSRQMTTMRAFVCPVCGEEFELSLAAFRVNARVLMCPCCGSVEVESIGEGRSEHPPDEDLAVA